MRPRGDKTRQDKRKQKVKSTWLETKEETGQDHPCDTRRKEKATKQKRQRVGEWYASSPIWGSPRLLFRQRCRGRNVRHDDDDYVLSYPYLSFSAVGPLQGLRKSSQKESRKYK